MFPRRNSFDRNFGFSGPLKPSPMSDAYSRSIGYGGMEELRIHNPNPQSRLNVGRDNRLFMLDLQDPENKRIAGEMGITDLNSANDLGKVLAERQRRAAAPAAAPSPAPAASQSTGQSNNVPGNPQLSVPGINVRLTGEQVGIKPAESTARREKQTSRGTSRLTIPRSSGASGLNLGM